MESHSLRITLIQSDIIWENPSANLRLLADRIENSKSSTDLIILPELFTTGFTMNVSSLAEEISGVSVEWMKKLSRSMKVCLTGSLLIKEQNCYFNRLIWMKPTGHYLTYDKRHLFRMGEEHLNYSAGKNKLIVRLKKWNIRPLICYDLRFPVWSRNVSDYDLLIYTANWPSSRQSVWETLLKARAIENQCYVIGLNRIGKDGMSINYSGDSMVIDYTGNIIRQLPANTSVSETVKLDFKKLLEFRKKFPAYLDADTFEIIP
ncbi:MAG: amidohydrolase [Bacteroides sp. SM23_62_1]|nr:MAG: amidohydrolase [Bacteroides sp. SM23_62_1]